MKRLIRQNTALFTFLFGLMGCGDTTIDENILKEKYGNKLEVPTTKLKVFHLGHSLVAEDMPAILQQLAGEGHQYHSQLGWGTRLQEHWEPELEINGFEESNSHPFYLDVFTAMDSGDFDAFVLTEGVEIKDAIKYHESSKYLSKYAIRIRKSNSQTRIYLYESWHEVTDKAGWINRLDNDYQEYWLGKILYKSLTKLPSELTIYVIPVGQVMASLFKEIKRLGGIKGLHKPADIFRRNNDGSLDPIHPNAIGNYLVALVHYAVLYQQSPVGLPYDILDANGNTLTGLNQEIANLMQRITWQVVSADYRTGIIQFDNK